MKYRPYPKYKSSGIEWLGDVPDHWQTPPLYSRYRIELGKMLDESRMTGTYLIPYLRNVDVQWDAINTANLPEMDIRRDEFPRYTLKSGDLLVCEGGEVGRAAIFRASHSTVGFQKALHRLRRLDSTESSRYMFYVLYWASQLGILIAEGNPNTIPHLTGEKLRRYRFPRPPIPEQQIIADSLDRETSKIDDLLAKKQELIERLKEKRIALISRTVTRGLPPDAARAAGLNAKPRVKPSGIEWLGEVPEHWEVKRVKHVGHIRYGLGEPPDYIEDGLAFIRATDIERGKIDLESVKRVSPHDIPWSRNPTLRLHEILVVRSGAYTGDSAIVTEEIAGCIAGYDMVLTVVAGYPPFVAWVLLSKYMLQSQIHIERLRAAQPHLNADELGGFVILVPPAHEQHAIADYLDRETTKIDRMVEKVEAAIERLQEYRSALITAAVTGKIDVRDQRHEH